MGGREKAPAAPCRKVAVAKLAGPKVVEVWGDGLQTRSLCLIDDCTEGIYRLMMRSDFADPGNLGQDRLISINDLLEVVSTIAGVEVERRHVPGPQGVRGRNSDNSRLRNVLQWEPSVTHEAKLERTYRWIEDPVRKRLDAGDSAADLTRGKTALAAARAVSLWIGARRGGRLALRRDTAPRAASRAAPHRPIAASQPIGVTIVAYVSGVWVLVLTARKFGDVFCGSCGFGRAASFSRSESRSRRVKRHWNGLAAD